MCINTSGQYDRGRGGGVVALFVETALEEVSSCPIGGGLVQVEKVVLGHLLEEVNLKGHWIHRLSDSGGGKGGWEEGW